MPQGSEFDYSKLWKLLQVRNVKKTELQARTGITPSTLARLGHGEPVSLRTLGKICDALEVRLDDVVSYSPHDGSRARSGTFISNRSEAIHRWYPYLEGYSKGLVENELTHLPEIKSVYDPFSGAGTTPLVASMNGITSYYSEVNPVMQFVANAKINVASQVTSSPNLIQAYADCVSNIENGLPSPAKWPSDAGLGSFSRFFPEDALRGINEYNEYLKSVDQGPIHELLQLALLCVAVPISKMVRRGDLRFATEKEQGKAVIPFWPALIAKLNEILNDLIELTANEFAQSTLVSSDAREAEIPSRVEAIITSPPYLNGTNYFRNTKLEMRLLNVISNESQLGELYRRGITAGINNVSKMRPLPGEPSLALVPILEELQNRAYDKRIASMVAGYFTDMRSVAHRMWDLLVDEGVLILDIGDSQFAGVHVPTHELLEQEIIGAGFAPVNHTILRTRHSRNGMHLTQRVMRYRKTGGRR